MATPIINEQMDAINESFSKISSDLTTIRPLLKNASIGAYPTDTASGSIASFTDGADDVPVKSLSVGIEPIQSGTGDPSPTNIRPITGHTEVNVYRTGKNLFDSSALVLKAWNGTGANATRARLENAIQVPVGTTLTFSRGSTATYVFTVQELDADYPGNASTNPNYDIVTWSSLASFTWTTTHPYVGIIFKRTDNGNITLADLQAVQMQIELGSTATDYEPYAEQTYNISLGQTVYGGTLNVDTGVLTVDRALVDLGSLTWVYRSDYAFFYTQGIAPKNNNLISSMYTALDSEKTSSQMGSAASGTMAKQAGYPVLLVKNTAYTDAAAFKTAMDGVQLVYELATPTTVQLTPTEVSTLLGENNIWADSGTVEVTYRADTGLYINRMIANAMNA